MCRASPRELKELLPTLTHIHIPITRGHGESILDARARGTKEVCNSRQYCSTGKALLFGVDTHGKAAKNRVQQALARSGVREACEGKSIEETVQRFVHNPELKTLITNPSNNKG